MEREIYGLRVLFERLQYDKAAFSLSDCKMQTRIAITGIKDKERLDLIKLSQTCGIHYTEDIKRKVTTHLIVGPHNPTPANILCAIEANIPVLHIHWLLDSIYHVQPLPTEKYLLVSIDPRLNLFLQHQTQSPQSQSQPSQPTSSATQQHHRVPMQSIDNIAAPLPPTSTSIRRNNKVTETPDLLIIATNDNHIPIVIIEEEVDSGCIKSLSTSQSQEKDQDNPLHAMIVASLQQSLQLTQQKKKDVIEQEDEEERVVEEEEERECSPLSPSHLPLSQLNIVTFTPLPSFNGYDDYDDNGIDSIGLTPNPSTSIEQEDAIYAAAAAAASPTPSLTPPPSQSNIILTMTPIGTTGTTQLNHINITAMEGIVADTDDDEEVGGDDDDDNNNNNNHLTWVNSIDHDSTPCSLPPPPSVVVCIEDNESDYFPSPGMTLNNDENGNKTNMFSRKGSSNSGLTQLSPSEIKIAKPCMSALSSPSSTKLLPKVPQGSTVKEMYGLSSLRGVQFAQQIMSDDMCVVVNVKDSSQMLRIVVEGDEKEKCIGYYDGEGSNVCQVLGQAVYLYNSTKINNNEWQVEYHQMYRKRDLVQLVQQGNSISSSHTVLDCIGDNEVVKSCYTRHAAVSDIQGAIPCLKMSAKAGATALNLSDTVKGGRSKKRYVWRGNMFDPYALELL